MTKFIKYFILFVISLNLYSINDMDIFFSLQKEKYSLTKEIKLISSIYKLGYPEKSKQKLYILLDNYTKKEFDENINKIFTLIDKKNFDKSIVNALDFIINKKKQKPLNKEIMDIYKSKNKIEKHDNTIKTNIKIPDNSTHKIKKNIPEKVPAIHKPHSGTKEKNIETAIVLSELLDDLDTDTALKYSLILQNDSYFSIISNYLRYLKNKDIKQMENINKKTPLYYHLLISIYKKTNKEKALLYLEKIKEEYPQYLKYNRIDL